ncbi:MAG: hypothetical protein OEV49_11635 [candidate division Zixibacteria bacterium]|nr:hypothetical protein [candidate division Zixibacteria bacterium]MDH3939333.1 hypothetical protein [candidate division Zixibacteria bacterium]MDH4034333.1 hypothetical protein [candidate division Zixibacteria bacterium]
MTQFTISGFLIGDPSRRSSAETPIHLGEAAFLRAVTDSFSLNR